MAIELKVEPYCQDCPEFEADVKKNLLSFCGSPYVKTSTIVYCKHRDRCNAHVEHLKQKRKWEE